jgi:hypothetical protein
MGIGVKITLIQLKKMIQPKKKMISSPKVKVYEMDHLEQEAKVNLEMKAIEDHLEQT